MGSEGFFSGTEAACLNLPWERSCWLTANLRPLEDAHAKKAWSSSSSLPSTSILLHGECELDLGLCSDAHIGDNMAAAELTALGSAL